MLKFNCRVNLLLRSLCQAQYFERHRYGVNPVQINDVIFSVHAFFACIFTIFQCSMYEVREASLRLLYMLVYGYERFVLFFQRGNQSVSRYCKALHCAIWAALAVALVLAASDVINWLDFLYACSYAKLIITLVKYVPQAIMNWRRKSTMGWSIGNVLLDFSGGILSIAQMFMLAYNNSKQSAVSSQVSCKHAFEILLRQMTGPPSLATRLSSA